MVSPFHTNQAGEIVKLSPESCKVQINTAHGGKGRMSSTWKNQVWSLAFMWRKRGREEAASHFLDFGIAFDKSPHQKLNVRE